MFRLWKSIERKIRNERNRWLERWGWRSPGHEPEPEEPTPANPLPPPASASNKFLWKPVSESDGRLVILTPHRWNGMIDKVAIMRGVKELELGRFVGDEHNHMRGHYRFSKPGLGYGTGLETHLHLTGGSLVRYSIPNGSARYDGINPI